MKRVLPSIHAEQPPHYWAVMRELTLTAGGFTVRDVHDRTNGPRPSVVKEYIRRCRKAGAVAPVGSRDVGSHHPAVIYAARLDLLDAPVVRRADYAADRGRRLQQIWQAMRLMGAFSVPELVVTASTDEVEVRPSLARLYVAALARAGYLVEIGHRMRRGQIATWRLLPARNTGPQAPAMTKAGIVDRNVGRISPAPLRTFGRAA
jgi:hypothetical protein